MTAKRASSPTQKMSLKDSPSSADLDKATSPVEWLAAKLREASE